MASNELLRSCASDRICMTLSWVGLGGGLLFASLPRGAGLVDFRGDDRIRFRYLEQRFDTPCRLCRIDGVVSSIKTAAGRPATQSLAEVAELADAHGSGPCTRKGVGVRVPSSAPSTFP